MMERARLEQLKARAIGGVPLSQRDILDVFTEVEVLRRIAARKMPPDTEARLYMIGVLKKVREACR